MFSWFFDFLPKIPLVLLKKAFKGDDSLLLRKLGLNEDRLPYAFSHKTPKYPINPTKPYKIFQIFFHLLVFLLTPEHHVSNHLILTYYFL